jgi:hypothetical protein
MMVAVVPVYSGELSPVLRLDAFVACQRVVSCVDMVTVGSKPRRVVSFY